MGGLPIPDYGNYAVQVYVNDELKKTLTFVVTKPPEQTAESKRPS
jgi:hypothetical protein